MKEFVVFYAWRSDRLERFNRHLIRFALNLAAKNISDDPTAGVRVRIDADTEGVLGHVPVTDTILTKIAACDAFVPDLTFIAVTESGKLVPNPNVLLEYGYALRAKSHSVMIPVMNTAYGPAEQLPFDMAHLRHPLKYELPTKAKDAERRAVRHCLKGHPGSILWPPRTPDVQHGLARGGGTTFFSQQRADGIWSPCQVLGALTKVHARHCRSRPQVSRQASASPLISKLR